MSFKRENIEHLTLLCLVLFQWRNQSLQRCLTWSTTSSPIFFQTYSDLVAKVLSYFPDFVLKFGVSIPNTLGKINGNDAWKLENVVTTLNKTINNISAIFSYSSINKSWCRQSMDTSWARMFGNIWYISIKISCQKHIWTACIINNSNYIVASLWLFKTLKALIA